MRAIRCLVIGDEAVGKTCMIKSYTARTFMRTYTPTGEAPGNYRANMQTNKQSIDLFLEDIAGKFLLRKRYYSFCLDIVLIVFSLIDPASLDHVRTQWRPELDGLISGSFANLRRGLPKTLIFLVGTKLDLREGEGAISSEQGMQVAKEIGAVKYLECSALTREGLDAVFEKATQAALVEIVKKGVARWSLKSSIISRDEGRKHWDECVVFGDARVGKSAMVISFVQSHFIEEYESTVEDQYLKQLHVDGVNVILDILDTSGKDEYSVMRKMAYCEMKLKGGGVPEYGPKSEGIFLFVFSLVDPESFDHVRTTFYPESQLYNPEVPVLLVGTKLDLREDRATLHGLRREGLRPISSEQGRRLAREIGAVNYIECSARTREGIEAVFVKAAQIVFAKRLRTALEKIDKKENTWWGRRQVKKREKKAQKIREWEAPDSAAQRLREQSEQGAKKEQEPVVAGPSIPPILSGAGSVAQEPESPFNAAEKVIPSREKEALEKSLEASQVTPAQLQKFIIEMATWYQEGGDALTNVQGMVSATQAFQQNIVELQEAIHQVNAHLDLDPLSNQEREFIKKDQLLSQFYQMLRIKLGEVFLACRTINSDLVTRQRTQMFDKGAQILAETFPGLGLVIKFLTSIACFHDERKKRMGVRRLSELVVDVTTFEHLAERLARKLTFEKAKSFRKASGRTKSLSLWQLAMETEKQIVEGLKALIAGEDYSAAERLAIETSAILIFEMMQGVKDRSSVEKIEEQLLEQILGRGYRYVSPFAAGAGAATKTRVVTTSTTAISISLAGPTNLSPHLSASQTEVDALKRQQEDILRRLVKGEKTLGQIPQRMFADSAAGELGLDRSLGRQVQLTSRAEDRERVVAVALDHNALKQQHTGTAAQILVMQEEVEVERRARETLEQEVKKLKESQKKRCCVIV